MLQGISADIKACYRHAEECARRAAAETDPSSKQDFLDMEERWLNLAHSYELTERIINFITSPRPARVSRTRPSIDSDEARIA